METRGLYNFFLQFYSLLPQPANECFDVYQLIWFRMCPTVHQTTRRIRSAVLTNLVFCLFQVWTVTLCYFLNTACSVHVLYTHIKSTRILHVWTCCNSCRYYAIKVRINVGRIFRGDRFFSLFSGCKGNVAYMLYEWLTWWGSIVLSYVYFTYMLMLPFPLFLSQVVPRRKLLPGLLKSLPQWRVWFAHGVLWHVWPLDSHRFYWTAFLPLFNFDLEDITAPKPKSRSLGSMSQCCILEQNTLFSWFLVSSHLGV